MRLRFFIFVAIIFSAVPRVSISDENPYDFNYSFDNDYPFSVLNDDRAYSGGQRLSLIRTTDRLPIVFRFLEWFTSNSSQFNSGFALGQQLYTPDDISRRDPIEDDEPYAAYLSGSFLSYLRNENTLHLFQVELGVVGPLALGENIQNAIHRFIGYRIAEGWDNQLKTEPILNLFYQQKRTFWALKDAKGVSLSDFVPNAAIAAGNLYVYGQVGAQFRLGYGLSDDFGPTMTTPMSAEPFVPEQRQPWEAYGFLAADFRYKIGRASCRERVSSPV